ncbi:MAG: VPGUxxT family thioredoxin-like (seleno)protein, type 2 [Candidatus Eisenbacteria bacterium]
MPRSILFVMFAMGLATSVAAADAPRELGDVHWQDRLEPALAESKRTGHPVLVLFQEIPGCATCTGFGDGPLSHPILVEAIETEFVPLAIHNNRSGIDAAVLARFQEPAWNNPVMRFINAEGRDVIPRRGGVYGTDEVAARLVAALVTAKRPVPQYLRLVSEELNRGVATVTLGMHCFWDGQASLGGIDGVTRTRAVYAQGGEAVEVTYDPARVAPAALAKAADARVLGAGRTTLAPESDQKRHLRFSTLRYLPLTPAQAARVDAALSAGTDATQWLSPRQRVVAAQVALLLARDPHALDGLSRPEALEALPDYQRRLLVRLGQAPRT